MIDCNKKIFNFSQSLICGATKRSANPSASSLNLHPEVNSDNRLTVTGTDPTGKTNFGTGPCVMNCNNLQGDIYSFHTGGANIAFADGSVRFVRRSLSIVTLAALVTKSSGEVIDDNGS